MVGRAEFAYLIAQMAFAAEMMDEDPRSHLLAASCLLGCGEP